MKISVLLRRVSFSLVTLLALLPACRKNGAQPNGGPSAGSHPIQVFLTDDPSLTFDNLFIDIRKLEVKVEDSVQDREERNDESGHDANDRNGDPSGGWMTLDIHPGVYDILRFRNGLDTLFSTASFSGQRAVRKVRLTLGDNNSVVTGGVTIPLVLSDNDRTIVIRFSDDLFNDSLSTFSFSLDIDGGNSIRSHGNRLELHPQVRAFRKERSASIEGRVLPPQAKPIVMAIGPSDTTTAKPGNEGEFRIEGLKPGVYTVLVHATAGAFADTTLNNIVISGSEDVKVGAITLHP
jgi:hypothetical protein